MKFLLGGSEVTRLNLTVSIVRDHHHIFLTRSPVSGSPADGDSPGGEEAETSSVHSDSSATIPLSVMGETADPQKPFTCHVCGSSFTRRDNLRVHMRKHTGDRPFSCQYCSKPFTRAYNCKQHMQVSVHAFWCTFCGPMVHLCALHLHPPRQGTPLKL